MTQQKRELIRRQGLKPSAERLETRIALSTLSTSTTSTATVPVSTDTSSTPAVVQPVTVNPTTTVTTPTQTSTSTTPADATAKGQVQLVTEQITSASTGAPRAVGTSLLTRGDQVVGFVVKFSKPMDPSAVQDLRNYHAYQITTPNKYLSMLTYQSTKPKANSLGLVSATYVPSSQSVMLLLSGTRKAVGQFRVELANPSAPKGPIRSRLAVKDLVDVSGQPLAGPTSPLGHSLPTPIMLRPVSQVKIDRLRAAGLIA